VSLLYCLVSSALSQPPFAGRGGGPSCGRFCVAASVRLKVYLFNNKVRLCFILEKINTYIDIKAGIE
jgi:hypothetical protein